MRFHSRLWTTVGGVHNPDDRAGAPHDFARRLPACQPLQHAVVTAIARA
jgi:hypothetical protein